MRACSSGTPKATQTLHAYSRAGGFCPVLQQHSLNAERLLAPVFPHGWMHQIVKTAYGVCVVCVAISSIQQGCFGRRGGIRVDSSGPAGCSGRLFLMCAGQCLCQGGWLPAKCLCACGPGQQKELWHACSAQLRLRGDPEASGETFLLDAWSVMGTINGAATCDSLLLV